MTALMTIPRVFIGDTVALRCRDDFAHRAAGQHGAVSRPCATDVNGPELKLGRQIAVDLEADADLNEGRRCPGHWSFP
jgi:hypothetical protein